MQKTNAMCLGIRRGLSFCFLVIVVALFAVFVTVVFTVSLLHDWSIVIYEKIIITILFAVRGYFIGLGNLSRGRGGVEFLGPAINIVKPMSVSENCYVLICCFTYHLPWARRSLTCSGKRTCTISPPILSLEVASGSRTT